MLFTLLNLSLYNILHVSTVHQKKNKGKGRDQDLDPVGSSNRIHDKSSIFGFWIFNYIKKVKKNIILFFPKMFFLSQDLIVRIANPDPSNESNQD